MTLPRGPGQRDAHYHPIKASATWAALVAAEQAKREHSAAADKATDAKRERETTYARHELGGH